MAGDRGGRRDDGLTPRQGRSVPRAWRGRSCGEGRVWIEQIGADSTRTVVRRFGMNSVVVREDGAWRVRWNRARLEPVAPATPAAAAAR
ncbi:MAG: hypothetical protein ACXWZS_18585 [Gemmatirosa sp.]